MRTRLLEEAKVDITKQVEEKTRDSLRKYGGTICTDGWSDVTNKPLLKVMLVCPAGDQFLGSIDTSGEVKDAKYMCQEMMTFVDKVGKEKIVQVCTDNAPVMVSMGKLLMARYPHFYFQGWGAHCLDLLLEDWGRESWVKKLIKRAKTIVVFIRGHHMSQAIFKRHSAQYQLINPGATRFATDILMIDRIVKPMGFSTFSFKKGGTNEYPWVLAFSVNRP